MLDLRNMDCMDLMRQYPDKHFDLAIVDPPYGIGMDSRRLNNRSSKGRYKVKQSQYLEKRWDDSRPDILYHSELKRVSRNQIVWGANYIDTPGIYTGKWIVWDKNGQSNAPDSSDCELAVTSFDGVIVKKFTFDWTGFGAINAKESRIHPTQKPVALYRWLLSNYAKPGDLILDTHLGSGSIAIACHDLGFDLVASELDADYFAAMQERLARHTAQGNLFKPQIEPEEDVRQNDLFLHPAAKPSA